MEPQHHGPELLAALERGDRVALAQITRVITGFLARYRAYELRQHWDDLIQEVIVALLRTARKGGIKDRRAFVSYVGTIVRRKLADHFEAQKKAGTADQIGDPEVAEAASDEPREEPRHPDELLDLSRALELLPEQKRRVVEAIYIQGHKYEDAARLLDIPLGTLKRLQTEGLRELRKQMGVG